MDGKMGWTVVAPYLPGAFPIFIFLIIKQVLNYSVKPKYQPGLSESFQDLGRDGFLLSGLMEGCLWPTSPACEKIRRMKISRSRGKEEPLCLGCSML